MPAKEIFSDKSRPKNTDFICLINPGIFLSNMLYYSLFSKCEIFSKTANLPTSKITCEKCKDDLHVYKGKVIGHKYNNC